MSGKFTMNRRHVINRCLTSYNLLIPKAYLHISVPCSKLNSFPQRNIHGTSSTRQLLSAMSALGGQSNKLEAQHSLLVRNKIQTSGLHTSYQCAAALSSGSDVVALDSPKSELMNDLVPNDVTMKSSFDTFDAPNVEDIFANGSEMAGQTLSSLGLGGYTPIGIVQHALDFAHITGLPWWGAIVCGTILFRLLVFPLMIKNKVSTAKLTAIRPEVERLQEKLRNVQNPIQRDAINHEIHELFIKNHLHPMKAAIVPLALLLVQLPFFFSFFIGLRRMAYLPVESMKTGGLFWFSDLTLADPYFILPVLCAGTMLLVIESGEVDTSAMSTEKMKVMKNVFRFSCVMIIPITYSFPTAIFMFWITSNFFSLGQNLLLKQPAVEKYFGLPLPIPPSDPGVIKSESFMENFRAGYKEAKDAHVENMEKKELKELEYKTMKDEEETDEYKSKPEQNEKLCQETKRSQDP